MKKLFIACIALLWAITGSACEICGCGVGNYYMGLLPQFNHRFIGVRYQFRNYRTRLTENPDEFSIDHYQTIELWGGWNLGKRWQILSFVPYNISHQLSDEGRVNRNGLGDIAVLANYKLFDKSNAHQTFSQQAWIGGGVKLATGSFEIDPADPDVAASANSQLGSGSTDFLLNAMYNVRIKKIGINTTASYKLNTGNSSDYEFGNRLAVNSFGFYTLNAKNTTIMPNIGVLYEHSGENKLEGDKVDQTGGYALLASAGVEFSFRKFNIGGNLQAPMTQNFASGQTESKMRGMLHVTFAF